MVERVLRTCGTGMDCTDVYSDVEEDESSCISFTFACVRVWVGVARVGAIPVETKKMTDVADRREQVQSIQMSLGMQPRLDSHLTEQYANGECDALYSDADTVAKELIIVDHIFQTTLYGEIIEEVMRRVAGWMKTTYKHLSWTAVWKIVRFYVPTMLKLHCLITTQQHHVWEIDY